MEIFTLNSEALGNNVKAHWDLAKNIENELTRLDLSNEEIQALNANNLQIRKQVIDGITYFEEIDIYINPNDPIDRKFNIITTYIDEDGRKYKLEGHERPLDFSELYLRGLQELFTGITHRNKP